MTIQQRQAPRADQYECKNCHGPLNKFSRQWTFRWEQSETFGDPPARVGRTTVLDAGAVCSVPCLRSYLAERYPSS